MPELAEVKITSEFVSSISDSKEFTHLEKSPVTKVKTELNVFNGEKFKIHSKARGKEFKIILTNIKSGETKELMMFLGMSGMFLNLRPDAPEATREKFLKHGHLRFHATDGSILVFYDVRRFGKWKWVEKDKWSGDRGPCPLTEYEDFRKRILENYKTHKDFNSSILHFLMNQYWCNGVGNYLRSEIIHRVEGLNPWSKFNTLSEDTIEQILQQCHKCPKIAHSLQGGQLKDWVNPFNESESDEIPIENWIKIYSVKGMSYITDKNGRRFWFHPKWNNFVPDEYKSGKFLLSNKFT
jgi:formamidopyrimidine-DNA glycosylase